MVLATLVGLSGCGLGANDPPEGFGPYRVPVPPRLRTEIERILELPAKDRFPRFVALLKRAGHTIGWYPSRDFPEVAQHDTVQLISFAPEGYGFCSGNLVDNKFVATAGHCLEKLSPTVPMSCEGRLVIAYRPTEADGVKYVACKQIVEWTFEGGNVEGSEVHDYAMLEIDPVPGVAASVRPAMTQSRANFNGRLRDFADVQRDFYDKTDGQLALALVVDPPDQDADNLASQFDIVLARFNRTSSCTRSKCVAMSYVQNSVQKGNSGGPVYWMGGSKGTSTFPRVGGALKPIEISEPKYTYVAPVYAIPRGTNDRFFISFPQWVLTTFRASIGADFRLGVNP